MLFEPAVAVIEVVVVVDVAIVVALANAVVVVSVSDSGTHEELTRQGARAELIVTFDAQLREHAFAID